HTMMSLLLQCCCSSRSLYSFPTRRSSDLSQDIARRASPGDGRCGVHRVELRPDGGEEGPRRRRLGQADVRGEPREPPRPPRCGRSEEHTLNSSHEWISYAVFCLKKKNTRC